MIAVSESTPGPIMVNLATYVGSTQAGLAGSVLATLAVVLPSFLLILLITAIMRTAVKNKYVQAVLRGLKPCIIGIVLATGLQMTVSHCVENSTIGLRPLLITAVLAAVMYLRKKKLSPVLLILLSALCGVVAYGI